MLAWALSLAGWIGIPALALGQRPGDAMLAATALALWLLTQAAAAHVSAAAPLRIRRGLRVAAGTSASIGMLALAHGGGLAALSVGVGGWGALRGLAGATTPLPLRAGSTAALGAALAWIALGDYTDSAGLAQRLAMALALAGIAVAAQRESAVAAPRLATCLLPLPATAPWSARLVAWSMLPMMCALPWIATLCRAAAWPPSLDLALHYLLMIAPAALPIASRVALEERDAALAGVALLGLGVALFIALPTSAGWLALTACQGLAWAIVAGIKAPSERLVPSHA